MNRLSKVITDIKGHYKDLTSGWIIISKRPKGLLSNREIESVISTLKEARQKGPLPPLHYEYKEDSWLERSMGAGGGLLWVKPKSGSPQFAAQAIDRVLKSKFGDYYKVEVD